VTVVYIAGPYQGASAWAIEENIRRAERLALAVWQLGAVALCPHANTRFFHGAMHDATWYAGDLELVARCDAVLLTEDWRRSRGATEERAFAESRGIPVFETLDALHAWLTAGAVVLR